MATVSATLYPTVEVPFQEDLESGIVRWVLSSGRKFLFDTDKVFVFNGVSYLPLAKVPNWQAGVQFSLGFDAGRTLQLLGRAGW